MMKKKLIFALILIVASVTVIVGLSAFVFNIEKEDVVGTDENSHVSSKGKYCSYTVGCDCAGFSPKTNGKEWEKSYCKRCGHHKKYHK